MNPCSSLPAPDPHAAERSARLLAHIRAQIAQTGGWVSFADYMSTALYAPELGYYSGGATKFGPAGDFITAPEITPLFGHALARQVAEIMQATALRVLEVGAGTGVLAADMLLALEALGVSPDHYDILEVSPELRARQAGTLNERVPELAHKVRWLDDLPDGFSGCMLANEVLDVMPVHRIAWRADGVFERGVSVDADGGLQWQDRPLRSALRAMVERLPVTLPEEGEYLSEICPAARNWVASLGDKLLHGAVLLIDYGYPQAEYYLPSRSSGTLQCYYRHRAHNELLQWPGLNDITAFVDFTAAAEAADEAGLAVLGYTSQAHFLHNCGLLDLLAARGGGDPAEADYLRGARAAHRLTGPHEMGELFKVLAVGKGSLPPLTGFVRGDRLHAL